ncbi:hypothetical protein NEAUS04_0816 [Nematocida ausubeli]|uniref:Uncharacterized protein n=1 Tax=Nematocida ausubeli (strain ATCC PRA-371 / ERTm2) TaxID=1913371 RepID=H8Z9W1_NEMA1|nr:uncharacterized protein NESG_00724 [Nematocida ausubeli]EHY66742.1 hypothetical protein NERG_00382 [Nematocida ausubeli]KAI5133471.1 hypothetical protein NEAUS06_0559 [Nematocida ausubeli]KAI5133688.1 hypothetical protein NEAUS07_0519 [Nematocida ausubeli]KAI5147249.1 hypothetical protein NEAUS05_0563 [Nematocida ausubeli]KAI5161996.1 hypothetical protein NEAUS04_0816 [Nematocida ausubeli]
MLEERTKESEGIGNLIKELSERRRKRKEISANLKLVKRRDVFDEEVKLDSIFTEKRSKSILKKAWTRVQGLWTHK